VYAYEILTLLMDTKTYVDDFIIFFFFFFVAFEFGAPYNSAAY